MFQGLFRLRQLTGDAHVSTIHSAGAVEGVEALLRGRPATEMSYVKPP